MLKISMIEPHRGYNFLIFMVNLGEKYPRLGNFYPIGADIFVFIYPIFLISLYLYGIIKNKISTKKEALFIFFSCMFSIIINICFQQFFDKKRPIYEFGTKILNETPLHQFLPSTSFPSDHAVVTFSIAMGSLLIALKYKNNALKKRSYFFFIIAIITGLCRIGTTVHRPTDILAGTTMGLLVPIILIIPKCYKFIEKWIFMPIIKLEAQITKKCFLKKTN